MTVVHRVLDELPCADLDDYLARGGGRGLDLARRVDAATVIDSVARSGLRGRGGAGFPTGTKWSTVARAASTAAPTTVVVNAAEGEPGTFKDRELLRRNPFKVLEGALIAARAVGASHVVVAVKNSFERERRLIDDAIRLVQAAGWTEGVDLRVALGPGSYLFGEETALLEVIEGRQPFPRVAPPYRRGLDPNDQPGDVNASIIDMAGPGGTQEAPALVDNVETLANVPAVIAEGPRWFRSLGTAESPGTIVCTITGDTRRHGVAEVPMGTPLGEIIDLIGGGARPQRRLIAAMSGVANPILPASQFGTPTTYEAMNEIGSGLGAAGFIVFDDRADLAAVAHAASQFLAVESCGQCEPCKLDGLAIAAHLEAIRSSRATVRDLAAIEQRLATVVDGARCYLAHQQQRVIASALALFPEAFDDHITGGRAPTARGLIAPIVDIVGGQAVLDTAQRRKQPDWTYGATDSGAAPAARYENQPLVLRPPTVRQPDPMQSSPAEDGSDPFAEITAGHRCLVRCLQAVRAAGAKWPDLRDSLSDLRQHLQAHDDLTTEVLYPMLERAAGPDGDDAVIAPHDHAHVAIITIEHLLASGPPADLTAIDTIERLVSQHIDADEQHVVPMMRDRLDVTHLDKLRDALATATAWRRT